MIFRNSKLDLGFSLFTALLNSLLSLVVLALLTDWPLLPFILILAVVFILYSGFTFVTWRAESLELTSEQLTVHFGIKNKQSKTLASKQVVFKRLRTKKTFRFLGLTRCELHLPDEQKITLTLRTDTAIRLEHYLQPQAATIPVIPARRLVFTDVFRFIGADLFWFRRALNLSALPLMIGILFFPDILVQIPVWFYLLAFIGLCLIMKIGGGIVTWLQTRFFLFERHGDSLLVSSGFLVPRTTIFAVDDIVMLELKQAFGYQLHQLASIHATLDVTQMSDSQTLTLAPLLDNRDIFAWFTENFPEIELQARQYRVAKHARWHYVFGAPTMIALAVSLILGFSSPTNNLPTFISVSAVALILIITQQLLLWRSSYLCQLDDAFIVDTLGLTRRFAYCRNQYAQALIHQSRWQKKNGLGTFRLSFAQQKLPTIFFKGIPQQRQSS